MTRVEENMKSIVAFCIFVLIGVGIKGLMTLLNVVKVCLNEIPSWLNITLINLNNGEGLIPTTLTYPIAFGIVGIILAYIPFSKRTNSIIGKICYWIVSAAIVPILIYINNIIFK